MAEIMLKGNPINTMGEIPPVGAVLGDHELTLTGADLQDVNINDFKGKRVILNIFLSLDTSTCANSVRRFNKEVSDLENTVVLCISRDLPFAQSRFCGAEGLENVITLSEMRNLKFGEKMGLQILNGPLAGLLARAVIVLNEDLQVIYSQLVPEVTEEPDYEDVLKFFK